VFSFAKKGDLDVGKMRHEILNEINKLKKSVIFFGSGIYQFLSVFYAKYQFSSVLRCDLLTIALVI